MSSREKILAAVAQNQPATMPLPDLAPFKEIAYDDPLTHYETVLSNIGGKAHRVNSWDNIKQIVLSGYNPAEQRVVSLVDELQEVASGPYEVSPAAHHLADVELAIIHGHFAVAENGAVWITEDLMQHRAVPFICQHLAVVVKATEVVDTMHRAYQRIANENYTFGTFIAGPSKTADIEQSLVLGAHGPRSMTVFLLS